MKMKIKGIVKVISMIIAFVYALSLAYGQIAWMKYKSIFVQITPLLIAFIVCVLCERPKGSDKQ